MSFHKVEYTSNEYGTEYRYEPEYPVDEDPPLPCFNCYSTDNTDNETGLCAGPCKPNLSHYLPKCKGNVCQATWTPEDIEEF